jgi:uncharacterized membrane protein
MKQIIIILLGMGLLFPACSKKPVYPAAPFEGNSVRIELAEIPEQKPVFFTFSANTRGINFFLLKTNGDVESYFDACGKCYPRKLGFRLEGNRVICRACDVSYHLEDLKDGIGSCYPIKLKGRVDGHTFVIDKQDILKGEKFF